MRQILLALLLLTGCVAPHSQPRKAPRAEFRPTVYVVLDCGDPTHDHPPHEDAVLDPDWPPILCLEGGD